MNTMRDKLVTIATFKNLLEAHMAAGKLKEEGIHAFLFDESICSLIPSAPGGFSNIRLLVPEEYAGVARRVLARDS